MDDAPASPPPLAPPPTHPHVLRELAAVFLHMGSTAFGGPAAHLAQMERELVHKRRWLSHQQFLDLIAMANLIPGPNSTEVAIHVGYLRGKWKGLIVAGCCFILPAAILVACLAWAYVRFGTLPATAGLLMGVRPVVVAVVVQALWRLGKSCLKTNLLRGVAVLTMAANFLGGHELLCLAGAGLLVLLARGWRPRGTPMLAAFPLAAVGGSAPAVAGLWPLLLVFLKIGSVLFGSGYVLLAFLRTDLVVHRGWLTETQLLDATAVGQVTPGPVFTTATFVGYLVHGWSGAVVATVGIFLPAFVFVALTAPLADRLRKSPWASAFLDGLNAGSLALMAVVTWELLRATLSAGPTALSAAIMAVSAALLFRNVNATWLVLAGAVAGEAWTLMR